MNISELKYDRLSEAERFLLDKFDGIVEYESDDDPDKIYYKKGDVLFFIYNSNSNHLYYSHNNIWLVFHERFGIKSHYINELIRSMVETNLKLTVKTTGVDIGELGF